MPLHMYSVPYTVGHGFYFCLHDSLCLMDIAVPQGRTSDQGSDPQGRSPTVLAGPRSAGMRVGVHESNPETGKMEQSTLELEMQSEKDSPA